MRIKATLVIPSKDALVGALLERFFQRALEPLPAMIDSGKTADDRVRELTDWMAAETRRTFREMPLSLELYAVAARQEKVRSFLRDSFSASFRLLAQLIRQGIERGEFRLVENTEDIAVVAGALMPGKHRQNARSDRCPHVVFQPS